jgi:DNA-binding MarR family transcriptional regulator
MDISTIDMSMKIKANQQNYDFQVLENFGRFRRALNLHFGNALRRLGLGVKQAALLRFLAKRGKASLAELSRDTLTDPAAMSRLVHAMLEGGILVQKDHPTDKRRWELALTPRGKKLALEVENVFFIQSGETLKTLSSAEKNQFSEILQKLVCHLSEKKSTFISVKINKKRKQI